MRRYRTPSSAFSGCDGNRTIFGIPLDFYAIAAFAVLITGIAKSGFAGGGAILAVPLLSLYVTPQVAAATTLPLLIMIDVSNAWHYRHSFNVPTLKRLLPGAVLGTVIGFFTFQYLSAAGMRIGVGAIALYFSLRYFLQVSRKITGKPLGAIMGFGLGALAGLSSFIAHAGGPPVNAFVLNQGLDKTRVMATLVFFFFIVNLMKLFAYGFLDQLNAPNMTLSLALVPFVPLGIVIGYVLHNRVSQKLFLTIAYGTLAAVGVKLLWDGVSGIL